MTEQQDAPRAPGRGPAVDAPHPPDGPGTPGTPHGADGTDTAPSGPPARFRRDRTHKVLGGVCAGLGRHCDMDPLIFRIVLAVLSVAGGLGLVFYGFVWLFVPFDGDDENEARRMLTGRVDGPALAGIVFALVGCGVFLSMLRNVSLLTSGATLALLLAGAGYWSRHRGDAEDPDPLAAQAVADAPPETTAPPAPESGSWWRDPLVKDGSPGSGTGYLWAPEDLVYGTTRGKGRPGRGRSGGRDGADGDRADGRRDGRALGGWVTLAALITAVAVTSGQWGAEPVAVTLQTGLGAALVVFGLGIAVSSVVGRTGPGTLVLAVVTAGLLTASSALPESITTTWLRTTWTPANAAQVESEYLLGTGVGTLDLRRATPAPGESVASDVSVGAGRLKVVVPDDARVSLRISVGLGDLDLPGDKAKDVDISPDRQRTVTLEPVRKPAPGEEPGTLRLTLDVGLGQAEVARVTP
ncbi:PspC domain-containing protein [Streptomyces sp. JNUCC 64]